MRSKDIEIAAFKLPRCIGEGVKVEWGKTAREEDTQFYFSFEFFSVYERLTSTRAATNNEIERH